VFVTCIHKRFWSGCFAPPRLLSSGQLPLPLLPSFSYATAVESALGASWDMRANSVVEADSVNSFKARLDKFWLHQKVKFDFNADLIGTGDMSGQRESGTVLIY